MLDYASFFCILIKYFLNYGCIKKYRPAIIIAVISAGWLIRDTKNRLLIIEFRNDDVSKNIHKKHIKGNKDMKDEQRFITTFVICLSMMMLMASCTQSDKKERSQPLSQDNPKAYVSFPAKYFKDKAQNFSIYYPEAWVCSEEPTSTGVLVTFNKEPINLTETPYTDEKPSFTVQYIYHNSLPLEKEQPTISEFLDSLLYNFPTDNTDPEYLLNNFLNLLNFQQDGPIRPYTISNYESAIIEGMSMDRVRGESSIDRHVITAATGLGQRYAILTAYSGKTEELADRKTIMEMINSYRFEQGENLTETGTVKETELPMPDTYKYENKCYTTDMREEPVSSSETEYLGYSLCVRSITVLPEGLRFNTRATAHITLKKDEKNMACEFCLMSLGSDEGNRNMYITDDLGNRYDHLSVGGDVKREITLFDKSSKYGWYLFPRPDSKAKYFIFHDDDVNLETPRIDKAW